MTRAPRIPNQRKPPPLPPPPRAAQRMNESGSMPRITVTESEPAFDPEEAPTPAGRPDLVPYQALLSVLDEAMPMLRLEIVELTRLYLELDPKHRRAVLELAARLSER